MRLAALAQATTADGVIVGGRALFRGYSIRETSGSAAGSAILYDAAKAGDTNKPIGYLDVAQGVSLPPLMFSEGVACERGIVIDVTGAVAVVIYYTPTTAIGADVALDDTDTLDLDRYQLLKLAQTIGAI